MCKRAHFTSGSIRFLSNRSEESLISTYVCAYEFPSFLSNGSRVASPVYFLTHSFRVRSLFFITNSPQYGNCFTFNSQFNRIDANGGYRTNMLTGPDFGLTMVLNVEQNKYIATGQTETVLHTGNWNCSV